MPKFLAVYTGTAGARPDPATMAKGGRAWGEWMTRHASQIVDPGGPLGKTKKVSMAGAADGQNNLAAYTIIEADDIDAAARMFENHPQFAIFPGEGVEIMPVMPIPSF